MTEVQAELQRRDALDALVAWVLVDDAEQTATGLSDPVVEQGVRDRLDAVLAALAAGLTVELPDAQVATLTPRSLLASTDAVTSVDAAETAGLTVVPFTISSTGEATLVAAPGGGTLLRLRRLSPTFAIRSPNSEPILQLKVGAVEVQRGNALVGRFDVTAAADTDAITLTVDALDDGGVVTGTLYYEEIT